MKKYLMIQDMKSPKDYYVIYLEDKKQKTVSNMHGFVFSSMFCKAHSGSDDTARMYSAKHRTENKTVHVAHSLLFFIFSIMRSAEFINQVFKISM